MVQDCQHCVVGLLLVVVFTLESDFYRQSHCDSLQIFALHFDPVIILVWYFKDQINPGKIPKYPIVFDYSSSHDPEEILLIELNCCILDSFGTLIG